MIDRKTNRESGDPYGSGPLLRRLWQGYLRPHRGPMAVVFLLMAIEGSTLGLLSWSVEPLFDRVFIGGESGMIWLVGGFILGLFVLRGVTSLVMKALLTRIVQRASTAMQVDLLAHIVTLDGPFFQENPPGSLMERVQGDTVAVQGIWQALLAGAGRDLLSLAVLMAVALSIDPLWTLAALVGAPFLILPTLVVQRYIRRKTAAMRAQAGLRSTRLDEVFHGIVPTKLNRMEGYQVDRFRRIIDRIVAAEVKMAAGRATIPSLIDVITGAGFFAVLVLAGGQIIAGDRSVGEFMAFFTAMALTFQPLRRLGDMAGMWQQGAASLERLYRLFDMRPAIRSPARPVPVPGGTEIRLEDVSLAYGDLPVLRGLSLTARAGETTALVGPSGAGKSTVFNLLTRLVEPQSGRITLGGVDIREMELAALRGRFSVVTQDSALFDETIRENILLGRDDVPEARLAEVLEAAHVADFVSRLPMGLDTPAGPRGSALSGGQRQRVAIARALLRDAPVLLMDEATSALDAQSEALVQDALDRLSRGRTTLVIAHRLSTVRAADRIVVMDRGEVVEEGRHGDLVEAGGLYADLYRLQFAGD